MDWAKTTTRRDKKHLSLGIGAPYIRGLTVFFYHLTGLILGLYPANERRHYKVTPSHWLGANPASALILSYSLSRFTPVEVPLHGDNVVECFETTIIFSVSSFQYLILAFCFSRGPPYRQPIWTNGRLWAQLFNSLSPGRFQFNFSKVIFKLTLVNGGWGISYEIALRWMPQDLTDDKSTLVQVMAWCHQTTSHYLSQCWPRFALPYGVTRPNEF